MKIYNLSSRKMHLQMSTTKWLPFSSDFNVFNRHYDDVIMTMLASQITSLTVVYSIVYSGVNQRKHQSSASLAFVRQIHRGPVNFPHKWPVTRKMFPFDDVIMELPNGNLIHRSMMTHCYLKTPIISMQVVAGLVPKMYEILTSLQITA